MKKKFLATIFVLVFCTQTTPKGPTYLSLDQAPPAPTIEQKDPAQLFKQANTFCKGNKKAEAAQLYTQAIALRPDFYQAYFNRGLIFWQDKQFEQAERDFRKALEIAPHYDRSWLMLADTLKKQDRVKEAIKEYRDLIAAKPDNFEAYLHLARILSDEHEFETAIRLFEHALQINPYHRPCRLDYANTLNMVNRTQEALENYYEIQTESDTNILHNIAYTLKKLGRIDEALPYYHKVIEVKPEHAEAQFGLGCTYIMLEDFIKGFAGYEWRWNRNRKPFPVPEGLQKWDGISDLRGKTILLQAEQGLGDSLQFIRYGRELKARGAYVIFASQNPLMTLLSRCDYIDEVVSIHLTPPPCDLYVSLMSLPHILKTEIDTIPLDIPYVFADEDLVQHWKQKLSGDHSFKIGICWQGNPNYSTPFLRSAVANKSVQLKQFEVIHNIPGVSLYCLQKMSGEDQLNDLPEGFTIHTFGPDFDKTNGRFMDTAALMKNLDLVLTVDTSVAHLAGALGVPVWVLLPEPADWRWMLRPTDTPWYPNMRLFRQPSIGDWDSVFEVVAQALKDKIKSHLRSSSYPSTGSGPCSGQAAQSSSGDPMYDLLEQTPWGA